MGSCGKLLLALIFMFGGTKVFCEDDTTMGPMFIKEPENRVDFSNTTGAIVECTARGSPRPEIIWIRADGSAVGDVPGLRQVKGDGNLVFPPFRAEDYRQEVHAQVYICMAKNRVGVIHSRDVNVRAVIQEPYRSDVGLAYVIRGNSVVLKCDIPPFIADFVSVVSWQDDTGSIFPSMSTESTHDGKYLVLPSGELHIRDVTPEDGTKSYQCRTKHRLTGETRLSATKGRLVITDPVGSSSPKFASLETGKSYQFRSGQSLVLTCSAQSHPVPTHRSKLQNSRQQQTFKDLKLNFINRLICFVLHKGTLYQFPEPVSSTAPKFPMITETYKFKMKSLVDLNLLCDAQGYPIPAFRWYKFLEGSNKKQAVTLDDRIKQVSGTLIIRDAKVEDSGKYLCVVNNSVGGESVETVLTVTAPLNAIVEPTIQTVDFGRPATLTCNYEGNPVKTISWLKDGKRLNSHDGRVLRIDSVRKEDKGMYQCFVRNEQESAQGSAELKLGGRFEPPQIKEYFNDNTMQPGVSLHLKCIASGNPTPEINWELDSKRLSSTERLRIGQHITMAGEVVSYLNISSVHTNDGGHYKCVAVSKVGTAEHTAHLNVYGLPFIRPMDKKNIVSGENLFVTCPVAGYPLESITWERDNRQLPINRKQKVFPNGTLIIENVERSSDQATYTCVARNAQGHTAKGNLEVQVMVPPVILPFAFDGETNAGDNAQLTCHVSKGDMPLELFWNFLDANNRSVPLPELTTVNRIGKKIAVLEIPVVTQFHRGTYVCTANNRADRVSQSAVLSVNVPPSMKPFSFEGDSNVGDTAQLTCHVIKGDTPLEIIWVFQGPDGRLQPMPQPIIENKIGKKITMLEIPTVTEYHRGSYSCIAKNRAGIVNQTAILMVNVPPSIMPFSVDGELSVGDNAQLTCHVARGDMPINISWIFRAAEGGSLGPLPEPILLNRIGKKIVMLEIPSVTEYHRGSYTCIATNRAGVFEHTVKLMVNVPPRIRPFEFESVVFAGEPVQLTCFVTGDKPLRISWYLQSKELTSQTGIATSTIGDRTNSLSIVSTGLSNAGNYTCVAQNAAGMDYHSAYLEVNVPPRIRPFEFESAVYAGEPVQLTCLVTKGDKPLRISWYLQSKELTVPQTGIITSNLGDRANSLSISSAGISNRGNYTCVAQNAVGMDSYSAYLEVNVPPRIRPFEFESAVYAGEPVQITCLVTKGDKPLRISWYFHSTELNSSETGVFTSSMGDRSNILSIPFAGLSNGGNYTCVAQNAVGMDYYSAYLEVNVRPKILPFSFGEMPSNAGDTVQVGCTVVKGDKPLRISWNFYGEELSSNMGVTTMPVGDSMNVLSIPSVETTNRGNYTCLAKNSAGYDSYTAQLLVNVRPQILPFSFGDNPNNAGDKVQVGCTVAKGDQPLRISWNFYSEELSSNMGVSTMAVGDSMNVLFIPSVAPSNRGNYTCVAKNPAGHDSYTAQLLVNVRPKILPFSFGDTPSNAGNTVQVACTVTEGDKPLRINWNFYGEELSSDMGVSTMPVGDSMNVLFISSVTPSNRGNYTCVANNFAGIDSFTAQLLVNVRPKILPFSFGGEPSNAGNPVQVGCTVLEGDKPLRISWNFYGENLSSNMGVSTMTVGDSMNVLIIPSVVPSNRGNYTCLAKNSAGNDSYTAQLIVNVLPKIVPFSFGDGPVNSGESIQVVCSVSKGDRPLTISWSFYGEALSSDMGVTTQMLGDTTNFLSIPSTGPSNQGNYTCIAKNSAGSDTYTSQLVVYVLPKILPFSFGDGPVNAGESVQLSCSVAKGDKPMSITWNFYGEELSSHMGVTTQMFGDTTNFLSIPSVSPSNRGNYTCIAKNSAGSDSLTSQLMVNVLPHIVPFSVEEKVRSGDSIQLSCHVSKGDKPLELDWLFNDDELSSELSVSTTKLGSSSSVLTIGTLSAAHTGKYTCIASNRIGSYNYSTYINVDVPPKMTPFTFGDDIPEAGETISIQCTISSGDIPVEFAWTFNGKSTSDLANVFVSKNGRRVSALTVESLTEKNVGNYSCLARNKAGESVHTASLYVNVFPKIKPFTFGDTPIYAGQSAQVTCSVQEGDSPLELSWAFDGPRDVFGLGVSVVKIGTKTSLLSIENTNYVHRGNYTCYVMNRAGNASYTASLNVHVPPRIVPFNFEEPIYSGQSAQITCLVSEGDTPLNITWWFRKSDKSELIPLPSGISVNKMGSKLSMLFIESTSAYFAGNYACIVENRAGSSKYTSALNVHGKMIFNSQETDLHITLVD
ncbi:Immunoglobulin subtype,Immunoglobulin-like domain,Immunoglobulin-like fold,Immunoglobulin subtype [Cinara cedri]|uniref:Immunoglobulin subtype,Immunoglobulin-like domain,Immunoglobulin-like fold,Immunoglobulin subtype n=1 Tax=Cinara cedri TaxID=506608 RepID=A0A5E4MJY7_9HEMI|nr:Immunoglobulin subtype,Immunoglobulin-like domain,Immunoglobulin-like fold,Immunoglobulin subtype [Cinara cedri]